jgi:hypothetical protein
MSAHMPTTFENADPLAKRAKADGENANDPKNSNNSAYQWKLTFVGTQAIRTLVDVIGNILNRISFRIMHDSKNNENFLCIDSIDPNHVCMCQARLRLDQSDILCDDNNFCIDSNLMQKCLGNIASHYSLDMVRYRDGNGVPSNHITLDAYDTLSNSHSTRYRLPTIADESESMRIQNMNYATTVEIDLGVMRNMIKLAVNLHSEKVEFSVHMPVEEDPKILRSKFTIASFGDAEQTQSFYSSTTREDGCENVIRAATDASSAPSNQVFKKIYSDSFSAQFLTLFLKSMERQVITMKLSDGKPLVLHYPLGPDKSYISFILAPKVDDDE